MFTKPESWYEQLHQKYKRTVLEHYTENMNIYASRVGKREVNISNLKNPDVTFIYYPSPGNMELKRCKLDKYLDYINKNDVIITPSGSTYQSTNIKESHFSEFIQEKKLLRKKIKQEMSYLESKSRSYEAKLKHFEQLAIKVGINAISGLAASHIYYKSTPCYNSITSTARHNVMCGYASIERLLVGNFYFHSFNDAINHIVNLLRIYPGDDHIRVIVSKYQLKMPSKEVVRSFLKEMVSVYFITNREEEKFIEFLDTLTPEELTFIYYAHNLKHLFMDNEDTFLKYLKTSLLDFSDITPDKIVNDYDISLFSLEDQDLLICIASFCYKLLKGKTLKEIDENFPDIKKSILAIYYHMEEELRYLDDLFNTFIFIYLNIQKPFEHQNMIRRCVILSDTDSNIFTTIHWIKWYTNDIRIDDEGIKIHSFIVYLVTKFLEHILALSCRECNIDTKNIKLVSMKNEFFYTTFLRTTMGKHYIGNIAIKEGVVLPNPKFDFKGKNFIGSDLPNEILVTTKQFALDVLNTFEKDYKLDSNQLISKIISLESKIIDTTIQHRKNDFLFNIPIKNKNEYKNYIVSYYFLYMLWQAVFSEKYDNIVIPSKTKSVPLTVTITSKNINKLEELSYLKNNHSDIFNNLSNFLKKYPNKKISVLVIPNDIDIPKELIPILDYKSVITRNMFGLYLIMRSLGIVIPEINNKKIIFSDIYKR